MGNTNLAGRAHGVACRLERGGRKRATLDGTRAVRLHKRRWDGDGATVHAQDARDSSTEVGARAQPSGGGRERGALGGRGERDPGPCSEGGGFVGLGASAQRRGARRAALRRGRPRRGAPAGLLLTSPPIATVR